jgi:hypothetical protein
MTITTLCLIVQENKLFSLRRLSDKHGAQKSGYSHLVPLAGNVGKSLDKLTHGT